MTGGAVTADPVPAGPRRVGGAGPDRTARRALAVALVAALVAGAPFLWWAATPPETARWVILDQTVPHSDWREHASLTWWLRHARVTRPDGRWYDARTDYVGFDPTTRTGRALTDADLAGARVLYIADAYGVYAGDYADTAERTALEPSARLFGGLTEAEVGAIRRFSARGGHVLAEFNTLESPTWGTPAGRALEEFLGVRFDGWLGRWYADLADTTEVPRWMRARWARRTGTPWGHRGTGYVVFGAADERIVVVADSEFTTPAPVRWFRDATHGNDPLVRATRDSTAYGYWVSGVRAVAPDARVLAWWRLHVTPGAAARLAAQGFPLVTPALVRRGAGPVRMYVAGELADVGGRLPALRDTRGLDWFFALRARSALAAGDARALFWNVSIPVWMGLREAGKRGG